MPPAAVADPDTALAKIAKDKQKLHKTYETKIQRVHQQWQKRWDKHKAKNPDADHASYLATYEAEVAKLKAEYTTKAAKLDMAENKLRMSQQTTEDAQNLKATQAQLAELKDEYTTNVSNLKRSVEVSHDHLKRNYELIDSLKRDQKQLKARTTELERQLAGEQKALSLCSQEKAQLDRNARQFNLDASTYQRELSALRNTNLQHEANIKNLEARLGKAQQQSERLDIAIRQAREEMAQEKKNHLALRGQYEDQMNHLKALNEGLAACHQKNVNSDDVLREMQGRYQKLKAKSNQMMRELEAQTRQSAQQAAELKTQKSQTQEAQAELQATRARLQTELAKASRTQKQAFQALDVCEEKGRQCLQETKARNAYTAKLEQQVKQLMADLKQEHKTRVNAEQQLPEIKRLQERLAAAQDQVSELRQNVKNFQTQSDLNQQMVKRHADLRGRHRKALAWIQQMKSHQAKLAREQDKTGRNLAEVTDQLHTSEGKMQQAAQLIEQLQRDKQKLEDRISKCLYPGEKERLEAQLNQLLKARQSEEGKMQGMIAKHDGLFKQLQRLQAENKDLKILKQRYEMDAEQIARITEQGAELNVELNKTQRQLKKKDSQLLMLSNQLAALLQRNKTLEQREKMLADKLGVAVAPEELDAAHGRLIKCRSEAQNNLAKLNQIQAVVAKLEQQTAQDKAKIHSLVKVLSDTENARVKLQKEHELRRQLEEQLKTCGDARVAERTDLETRIQAVERQYRNNLKDHERMMTESKARIADLEAQLGRVRETERRAVLRQRADMPVPVATDLDDATADDLSPASTMGDDGDDSTLQETTSNFRAKLAALEIESMQRGNYTEAALRAAQLAEARALQNMRLQQLQQMRDKESEIMHIRQNTFDDMLHSLNRANQSKNISQDKVALQLRQIRAQGAAREKAAMQDMLRMRALNQKLATTYRAGRETQWNMLHGAYHNTRMQLSQQLDPNRDPTELYPQLNSLNALSSAQSQYLLSQRRDGLADLRDQQAYVNELEQTLSRMRAVERNMNTTRFPNLDVLRSDVLKDQYQAASALRQNRKAVFGQQRALSAEEARVQALGVQMKQLSMSLRRAAQNPSTTNLDQVRRIAAMDPLDIQKQAQDAADLRDNQQSRVTYLVHPGQSRDGQSVAIDQTTNELRLKTPGGQPPARYFGDKTTVLGTPRETFAPSIARVQRAMQLNHDLIVVSYSADERATQQDGKPLLYVVFLHALQQIWPVVQNSSPNGTVEIQLVRVLPQEQRLDLLDRGNGLRPGCAYKSCSTTKQTLSNVTEATRVMSTIFQQLGAGDDDVSHTVLSLGWPGSTNHIHITDVLYLDPNKLQANPAAVNLVDSSWITYLSDVLEEATTKVDLYFNILPNAAPATNQALADVSDRVSDFLEKLKVLQAKERTGSR